MGGGKMKIEEMWRLFKSVVYGDNHMGAVVYVDLAKPGFNFFPELGRALIFSGVTNRGRVSTINDAEEIIAKIMNQESINFIDRDFYDLQTWKGYEGDEFKPGYFVLDKLAIKQDGNGRLFVEGWLPILGIPENFRELFSCLIGYSYKC